MYCYILFTKNIALQHYTKEIYKVEILVGYISKWMVETFNNIIGGRLIWYLDTSTTKKDKSF